jgi:hypothetical protein
MIASQLEALITGLQTTVSGLESTAQQVQGTVNFNLLPIGSIVLWWSAKDPPSGWVKCDGSDSRGPNLSGDFLRAGESAQLGAQGGAETETIPQFGSNNHRPDGNGWSLEGSHYVSTDNLSISTLPPFISVVYIMKISNS